MIEHSSTLRASAPAARDLSRRHPDGAGRLGAALAALAALLVALGVVAGTAGPAQAAGSARTTTHTYANGQQLDAFYTTGTTGRPWVVIVHGGSWNSGSRTSYSGLAEQFRSRGYAAFSIDYRLSTQARWPAQRDDATAALAWIKARATTFGIDPRRSVVIGHSAGGHIALAVGTAGDGGARTRGVVDLAGVYNPHQMWVMGTSAGATAKNRAVADAAVTLMGCRPDPKSTACWERWRDASISTRLDARDAPVLAVHAAGDGTVPAELSRKLDRRCEVQGLSCDYRELAGTGHGAGWLLDQPGVRDRVFAFVASRTR